MAPFSRRAFIKNTAWATAGVVTIPYLARNWYALAAADAPGYFAREFGITDALCRKTLAEALSKGGDYAELYFEHTVRNWLVLEDGQVNQAYSQVDLGVGIRTVKGDQIGYGYTQQLAEAPMLAAAAIAATIASGSASKTAEAFTRLGKGDAYPLDRLLTEVPLESKIPLVQQLNDQCFARSPLVAKVTATFHDEQRRVMIVTSDGTITEDLQPKSFLAATVVAERDGRRERA